MGYIGGLPKHNAVFDYTEPENLLTTLVFLGKCVSWSSIIDYLVGRLMRHLAGKLEEGMEADNFPVFVWVSCNKLLYGETKTKMERSTALWSSRKTDLKDPNINFQEENLITLINLRTSHSLL